MNISIVVVTHNRVTALCELLESIAKQSVEPFEVIIVNVTVIVHSKQGSL